MQKSIRFKIASVSILAITLIACVAFAITNKAHADTQTTYYVSPQGSDGNNGLAANAPFRTLEHARDVVRGLAATMSGDIVVNLLDGTYPLASPLTFDGKDSGTNGKNIIWQADGYGTAKVAHPILSGGKKITDWTQVSGTNIWKATVDKTLQTRQLYVNGIRAQRATANAGIPGNVTQTSTGYTTNDTSMQRWHNPQDIEFVYSGDLKNGQTFQESRCGVASITGDAAKTTITMQQPCYDIGSSSVSGSADQLIFPRSIENAYELLSQPGQWYLDHSGSVNSSGTSTLYYRPRSGEELSAATIVAPTLETLVQAQGTSSSPVQNLQFKGLTFAYATWLQPSSKVGFIQNQSDTLITARDPLTYDSYQPGNVAFHKAQNIRLERNTFTHLGGEGLVLDKGAQNDVVIGNVFADISGTGLRLGDHLTPDATGNEQEKNNTITDNYIHDVAVEYHGDSGFHNVYSIGTNFSHNEIARVSWAGIEVGNQCASEKSTYSTDDHFSNNYVHDVMESSLSDGGGIYVDAVYPNTTVDHNFFDNDHNAGSFGGTIYIDCYAHGFTAASNVITHSRVRWLQAGSFDNTVQDNFTDSTAFNDADGKNKLINNQMGLTTLPTEAKAIIANAGIEASYRDILNGNGSGTTSENGTTTIDAQVQGDAENQFNYQGSWDHCVGVSQCGDAAGVLYNDSNSWSDTADSTMTIAFTGTAMSLYGVQDPTHGIGAVSIDGGQETQIDFYGATRVGNVLLWKSPTLSAGKHTFKLRVTGEKNAKSSHTYVAVDKVTFHS